MKGPLLTVGAALLWTATLWPSRYYGLPFGLGLLAAVAAVGLPAYLAGKVALAWDVPRPGAWVTAGYCLGSGITTAILMGGGEAPLRYLSTALVHAVSFTVLAPVEGAGFAPLWGDLLWLAVVIACARYTTERPGGGA